jgi:hypothetical protein
MRKLITRLPLRFGVVAVLWGVALTALVAAPVPAEKQNSTEKVRKELDQTISLDIKEQGLHLALNQIKEKTKLNFFIDKFTMQQMGIDPEQTQVTVELKDVKVRSALRTILTPYNLSYAVLGDTVLITSDEMAMYRQMRQRVNIDFDKVDFATAVKQLSRETVTNVIIDKRIEKEAKEQITLQMEDVPLETAVRLMAEMIGLKPVRIGNTLFVTNKANANEMRADPDLAPIPQPGARGMQELMIMQQQGLLGPGGIGVVPGGVLPGVAPPAPPVEDKKADPAPKDGGEKDKAPPDKEKDKGDKEDKKPVEKDEKKDK